MNARRPPEGFPVRFGADVVVSDIDLDAEEFVVDGERLTTARAADLAEGLERRRGRPSLGEPGRRSPALSLRLAEGDKEELEQLAFRQGRRPSDVVREALREYLDRHAS